MLFILTSIVNIDLWRHRQRSSLLLLINTAKSCHSHCRSPLSTANATQQPSLLSVYCPIAACFCWICLPPLWLPAAAFSCLLSSLPLLVILVRPPQEGRLVAETFLRNIWIAQHSDEWHRHQLPSQCASKWEDDGWWPHHRNARMLHDNLPQVGWKATAEEGILLPLHHGLLD